MFFPLARVTNPAAHLRLYTNVDALPVVDGVALDSLLKSLGVEVVTLPFTFNPTPGHSSRWRNQFFIFDILSHLGMDREAKAHILLDSDCVIRGDLGDMVRACASLGSLTLDCGYPALGGTSINGLTLAELNHISRSIAQSCGFTPVGEGRCTYAGGEFFCATPHFIRTLVSQLPPVWSRHREAVAANSPRFMEEAHMLSFFYWLNGISFGMGNPYVRRIWTALRYHNVSAEDLNLAIWHLPAEKHYGFRRTWSRLVHSREEIGKAAEDALRMDTRYFGVPRRTLWKGLADVGYRLRLRALREF